MADRSRSFSSFFEGLGLDPPKAGKRRTAERMDPKTFFANERTFAQWQAAGMLLLTVGIAVTKLEDSFDTDQLGGMTIIGCSLVIMLYGLVSFLHRLKKIKRKDPTGYDDPLGPVALIFVLFAAVALYLRRMYGFNWDTEGVLTADTPFFEAFKVPLAPSHFADEAAAVEVVARALQASAAVASVTLANATFELLRRTHLDTHHATPLHSFREIFNASGTAVTLTTLMTAAGARRKSRSFGSGSGKGTLTGLAMSIRGGDFAELASTAANCVGRYAAHCDVRIVRTSHAMARELTVTRLPHTSSVTSVGDLRGYFALPRDVGGSMRAAPFLTARWSPLLPARPSCSDGERLYVVGEHYYWRVRLPFSLAAAPESRLVASLTTRYDTPQLAVRPDRAPREDSELSFRLASQAPDVTPEGGDLAGPSLLAARALYSELRSAPWAAP